MAQQLADARARVRDQTSRPSAMNALSDGAANTPGCADIEPAVLASSPEIEHVIADGDADARGGRLGREHAVRQVLDREVAVGRRDEGAQRGVVGVEPLSSLCRVVIPAWQAQTRNPFDLVPDSTGFRRPELLARFSRLVRIKALLEAVPAVGVVVLQRRELAAYCVTRCG